MYSEIERKYKEDMPAQSEEANTVRGMLRPVFVGLSNTNTDANKAEEDIVSVQQRIKYQEEMLFVSLDLKGAGLDST